MRNDPSADNSARGEPPGRDLAPNTSREWSQLLDRFEAASAGLHDCHEDHEIDAGADLQLKALVPLLLTPAPNLQAMARKFEIAFDQQAYDLTNYGSKVIAALLRDVRHFAGEKNND